jgi:nitrite reductase (NO-forming)
VLFVAAMVRMERRSLQQARWAVRWYEASAGALAVGVVLGVLMARGTVWTHGSLLGAHLALNLGGWFGAAIIGTMHTLFPSLTQTRLAHPRLQGATFGLWTSGIAAIAFGAAFDGRVLLACGWIGLLGAALLLGANMAASLRAAPRPLSLAVRLLAAAHAFLPAGLLLAFFATVAHGSDGPFTGAARPALATLLLAGWIGLTVGGSLMHLLAVLGRVRDLRRPLPAPRPLRDRTLTAALVLGVAAAALSRVDGLAPLSTPAIAVLLAAGAVMAGRVIVLAVRAAPSPPRA